MRHARAFFALTVVGVLLTFAAAWGAESRAAFQAKWDALVAAAKKEGKLVAIIGGGGESLAPIYDHFSKKFGIRVVLGRGSGREHAERILAEQSARKYTVDIIHTGANSGNLRFIANKIVQEVRPFLFHPEVINESLWFGNKLWWTDATERFQLVFNVSVSGPSGATSVWWNTNLVSLKEAASWKDQFDLLKEIYKGKKIVSLSKTTGGATGGDLKDYIDPNRGPKWLERFYVDMGNFFTADFDTLIDGLALGRFHLAIDVGRSGRILRRLRDKGAPIERYSDAFDAKKVPGLPLMKSLEPNSTSGMLMIGKKAPHPNAAKLWVNWLLSREGQTFIQKTPEPGDAPGELHDNISLRRDVTDVGLTDPAERWKPGVQYAIIEMNPKLRPLAAKVYTWLRKMEVEKRRVPWPFDPADARKDAFVK